MTTSQYVSSTGSAAAAQTTDYKKLPLSVAFDEMLANTLRYPGRFDASQAANMVLNKAKLEEPNAHEFQKKVIASTMSGQVDFRNINRANFVYTAMRFLQQFDAQENLARKQDDVQLNAYLQSQRFYQVLNLLLNGTNKAISEQPHNGAAHAAAPVAARTSAEFFAKPEVGNPTLNGDSAEAQLTKLGIEVDTRDKNILSSGKRPSIYEELSESQRTLVRHKFAQLKVDGKLPSKSALARITQEVGKRDAEPGGTSLTKLIEQFQFTENDFTRASMTKDVKPEASTRTAAASLAQPVKKEAIVEVENDLDAKLNLFDQGEISFKDFMREIVEHLDIELPSSSSYSANVVMKFLADEFDPTNAVMDLIEFAKLKLIATAIKSDPETVYGELLREEGNFSKLIDNLSSI